MGDRVPYFLRPLLFAANKGQSARSCSPWETSLGGRGEETEPRRAAGCGRENRMLQTPRGSAAAAPAPAPGEMLMGSCRIWRLIGRREFGATSSSPCHWLGAICCSLSRELLAPPPLSFSVSARLPPAAGPVPGIPRPRGARELAGPGAGGPHTHQVHVCARVCGPARAHAALPLGAPGRGQAPPGTARREGESSLCPRVWDVRARDVWGAPRVARLPLGDRLKERGRKSRHVGSEDRCAQRT